VIWQWVAWTMLAGVLIAAAVFDLRRGIVYNWLTYPAILAGLGLGALQGVLENPGTWNSEPLLNHAEGMGFAGGVLFVAYLLGGMGGGDVKLMAAVGAFLGWPGALHGVFYSFLVGAAMGLIIVVWKGQTRVALRRLWTAVRILPLPTATMEEAVPTSTLRVPFGFAVCVGTLWYMAEEIAGTPLYDVVRGLV
jgi:prepilin peptidase CpaA